MHPTVVPERVQLAATCLGDLVFPTAVADAVSLIEACGIAVVFPAGQICCGQPAFNAGHRAAARRVARSFVRSFSPGVPVVVPSGSCAAMIHRLPELLGCRQYEVYELTAFLERSAVRLQPVNRGAVLAYHTSCHAARELGQATPPLRLLEETGAKVVPLLRPDLCCGFGGTFSVRQPEVSVAMADDRLGSADGASALVTGDPGCLMHLRSRSARVGGLPVVHVATALARGVGAAA